MAEAAKKKLLPLISKHLENCFDVVHARSVCRLWRSTFPFPSFRAPAAAALPSEYLLGGVSRDKSEDRIELFPYPFQCSVKVEIPEYDPVLLNMLDCQILPLGYQYRMIGWDPQDWTKDYRGMAFLPLNMDGGGGKFVVLLNYAKNLLVLGSAKMRWMRLKKTSDASCSDLVAFRGRFYAEFLDGDIFIFDPYSMRRTPLMPSQPLCSSNYLIPSGNDELFMAENFNPIPESDVLDCSLVNGSWSMSWETVYYLLDTWGNVSCSAKELPDGCGLSGNSIVFTSEPGNVTFSYKYGVHTGRA